MALLQTLGRLAPTVGGIVGGIGGELIDPFGGGIAGAALGSGLGKAAENATQGQNPLQMNDLGAAAEGAIGQGTGDLLGGVLGKVGGSLGGFGVSQGEKVAQAQGIKDIMNEFPGITTQTEKDLNFAGSIGHANEMGIPNTTEAWLRYGNAATGPEGVYTKTLDNIANSQGPVDLSKFPDKLDSIIDKYAGAFTNPEQSSALIKQRILNTVQPGAGDLYSATVGSGSSISPNVASKLLEQNFPLNEVNPQDALNAMRNIREQMWRPLMGKGGANVEAQKGAYNEALNAIRDTVYGKPEIQDAVKNFTVSPELKNEILTATNGDETMANHIENVLNSAQTPADITKEQAQAIDMREAASLSHDLKTKTVMGGPEAKAILQAAEEPGVAEKAVADMAGGKANMIAKTLRSATQPKVSGPVARKVGGLLERMSPFADGTTNNNIIGKIPGAVGTLVATSPNAQQGGAQQGASMNTAQTGGTAGGGSLPPLLTGYNTALGMMTLDPYLASSLAPVVGSLAPQAQKLSQVESLAPQLEQYFQQAGGGQGPLLGGLSQLGGMLTGGPAARYQALRGQVGGLLQQLGIPAGLLPSIMMNQQSANQSQQGLNSVLSGGVLSGVPANLQ